MQVSSRTFNLLYMVSIIFSGISACAKNPVDVGENEPPSVSCMAPLDGSTGRAIDVELQWNASDPDGDPLRFDVLLDNNTPPTVAKATDIAERSHQTEGLDYGELYYWRIVVRDDAKHEVEGPVWSFTTMADPNKGAIVIDQIPDVLVSAGWSLTGPQDVSGSDDTILANMPIGVYRISWNTAYDHTNPAEDTKTLVTGETITFRGTYMPGRFIWIPAGTFVMGSPEDEPWRYDFELQHSVTLTKAFYLYHSEVMNIEYAEMAQWAYDNGYCTATSASLRDNLDGSIQELLDLSAGICEIHFSEGTFTVEENMEDYPVMGVNWYGSVAYCDWMSLKQGLPRAYNHSTWQCNNDDPYRAIGYRLPTEAEWEYSCRAGTQTPFNTGECLGAGTQANYNGYYPYADCPDGGYEGWTVSSRLYPPNNWGLYEMHGNLWEWCNDWWDHYDGYAKTDPVGPISGWTRVVRGGSWYFAAHFCRSASRYSLADTPDECSEHIGFRPAKSVD